MACEDFEKFSCGLRNSNILPPGLIFCLDLEVEILAGYGVGLGKQGSTKEVLWDFRGNSWQEEISGKETGPGWAGIWRANFGHVFRWDQETWAGK